MPIERTGRGDPARTLALLWNEPPSPDRPPRGPRPRLQIDSIAAMAMRLADDEGLAALTMRGLAARLALASPNALYTYVPSKAELIDLIVDRCFGTFELDAPRRGEPLVRRVRAVADANLALYLAHHWLADVAIDRPPLGPGQMRKYELEIAALDGCGLSDHQLDLAIGLIISFVRGHVATAIGAAGSADEQAWWNAAGPALARHVTPADFPLAARVGQAAGEAQGRATAPDRAYEFGITSIATGILAAVT
jgi:AcrR family transcriptional regulator